MQHVRRALCLAFAATVLSVGAHAATDPQGDLLASFTGQRTAALDIVEADVSFDAAHDEFLLHATTAGPIAGASGAAYVFGFDTGGAVNTPFGAIGEPGVAFNSTVVLKADGTGTAGTSPVATRLVGDEIFGTVSASQLPSHGAADANYTWALWSIDSRVSGLARNADFAPDVNLRVSAVPEPTDTALLAAGLGLLGLAARRRRAATAA